MKPSSMPHRLHCGTQAFPFSLGLLWTGLNWCYLSTKHSLSFMGCHRTCSKREKRLEPLALSAYSVPHHDHANLSFWTVMVAVDRLERIPDEIEFHDADFKFYLRVQTKNWIRSPSTRLPTCQIHYPNSPNQQGAQPLAFDQSPPKSHSMCHTRPPP